MSKRKTNTPAEPTALDVLEEMESDTSLNRFFDANPRKLTDDDLKALIGDMRRSRAMNVEKGDDS